MHLKFQGQNNCSVVIKGFSLRCGLRLRSLIDAACCCYWDFYIISEWRPWGFSMISVIMTLSHTIYALKYLLMPNNGTIQFVFG